MTQVVGVSQGFFSGERPIDLVHLSRMTLGDRTLEREALQLFDRQTNLLMTRMRQIAPGGLAAVAHTLKGSASGIGAWQVARAAQAVEVAAGNPSASELRAAVDRLRRAADEARAVIADLLLPS
jgi:HPt (histidine-containing phosphotransfer) domain-containing protein